MIRLFLIFTMLLSMVPIRTDATTITFEIRGLEGTYVEGGPGKSADFDWGVRFSSIDSAILEITGYGSQGLTELCPVDDPTNCTNITTDPTLAYRFVSEPSKGTAPSHHIGPFESPPPQTLSANLSRPGTSLDFLLDGAGTLNLRPETYVYPAIYFVDILIPFQVTVTPGTVTVEITGNLIPEPGTFFLSALGIAAIATIRRKPRNRPVAR